MKTVHAMVVFCVTFYNLDVQRCSALPVKSDNNQELAEFLAKVKEHGDEAQKALAESLLRNNKDFPNERIFHTESATSENRDMNYGDFQPTNSASEAYKAPESESNKGKTTGPEMEDATESKGFDIKVPIEKKKSENEYIEQANGLQFPNNDRGEGTYQANKGEDKHDKNVGVLKRGDSDTSSVIGTSEETYDQYDSVTANIKGSSHKKTHSTDNTNTKEQSKFNIKTKNNFNADSQQTKESKTRIEFKDTLTGNLKSNIKMDESKHVNASKTLDKPYRIPDNEVQADENTNHGETNVANDNDKRSKDRFVNNEKSKQEDKDMYKENNVDSKEKNGIDRKIGKTTNNEHIKINGDNIIKQNDHVHQISDGNILNSNDTIHGTSEGKHLSEPSFGNEKTKSVTQANLDNHNQVLKNIEQKSSETLDFVKESQGKTKEKENVFIKVDSTSDQDNDNTFKVHSVILNNTNLEALTTVSIKADSSTTSEDNKNSADIQNKNEPANINGTHANLNIKPYDFTADNEQSENHATLKRNYTEADPTISNNDGLTNLNENSEDSSFTVIVNTKMNHVATHNRKPEASIGMPIPSLFSLLTETMTTKALLSRSTTFENAHSKVEAIVDSAEITESEDNNIGINLSEEDITHTTSPCVDLWDRRKMYDSSALLGAAIGGAILGGLLVFLFYYAKGRCNRYIRGDYRRVPLEYDFELNPRLKTT